MQSVGENKLSKDNGCTLKVHSLPTVVFQSFDIEQRRLDKRRSLRQEPFEVRKEGRIVKGPFRRFLERVRWFREG